MVTVPSFILRRLYVKGSLRSTGQGLQFQLLNKLGSGYARRLLPLMLDGVEIPVGQCSFLVGDKETPFAGVSPQNPFTLALNKLTTVTAGEIQLTDAPHRIEMRFEVAGLGTLRLDFTDTPNHSNK